MGIEVCSGSDQDAFEAKLAIVCYQNPLGEHYASVHAVKIDNGEIGIGAGQPMRTGDLQRMVTALNPSKKATSGTFVPKGLVYMSSNVLAWKVDAHVRDAFFRLTNENGQSRTAKIPYPNLVFVAKGSKLGVVAVKSGQEVTADSEVCFCPAMNVFSNMLLCIGNIKIPKSSSPDAIKSWENGFFNSEYTHPNQGQNTQINYKKGMVKMWKSLEGKKKFPDRFLMEAKNKDNTQMTVRDFISYIERTA